MYDIKFTSLFIIMNVYGELVRTFRETEDTIVNLKEEIVEIDFLIQFKTIELGLVQVELLLDQIQSDLDEIDQLIDQEVNELN